MSKDRKTVFAVYENTDKIEGKGGVYITALFSTLDEAQKAAKGHGTWGSDATIRELSVHESYESYVASENDSLRQRAISKLTDVERKALGLPHLGLTC